MVLGLLRYRTCCEPVPAGWGGCEPFQHSAGRAETSGLGALTNNPAQPTPPGTAAARGRQVPGSSAASSQGKSRLGKQVGVAALSLLQRGSERGANLCWQLPVRGRGRRAGRAGSAVCWQGRRFWRG